MNWGCDVLRTRVSESDQYQKIDPDKVHLRHDPFSMER